MNDNVLASPFDGEEGGKGISKLQANAGIWVF